MKWLDWSEGTFLLVNDNVRVKGQNIDVLVGKFSFEEILEVLDFRHAFSFEHTTTHRGRVVVVDAYLVQK